MKIKLLSNESWTDALKDMEKATDKLGIEIEPSFYFLGHMPSQEYREGRYGIDKGYLSTILPNELVILHADFPVNGASGWFSVINGNPVIQIYLRGLQSMDPDFKYWESETIIHELCHYQYWKNGLEDRTHYFHYERNSLMSAVEDITHQLYIKKIGLLEKAVRLLRQLTAKLPEEETEKLIVVHHSATPKDTTRVETLIKNISKKYEGGFYDYYIDKNGVVYPQEVSSKYRDTIDVCVIGDFTTEKPTQGHIQSLRGIIDGRKYISHKELAKLGRAKKSECPGELMEYL